MYYSVIGILAAVILLIESQDILLNLNKAWEQPSQKIYRRFLYSVLVYYITDILWGILESRKLIGLLFTDTSIYFIAMAVGILFWTQYVVTYLAEENGFGLFLVHAGRVLALLTVLLSVFNIFEPVMFTVDKDCVYHALGARYAILAAQIILLILISAYAFLRFFRIGRNDRKAKRYSAIAHFGMIMALFLFAQTWFAYLPLYSIAFMLGTSLLRSLVLRYENEDYRQELEEAAKITELKHSISALLDNMPALSFYKDAETGVYLACNQAFAEYAHKDSPEEVCGLTDAQIFDPVTASHFVEDDRMALSMEEPYIFFEDVPDAAGNQRQFQTTKLKFIDGAGRLCLLGMCQDVTDMVRIQRENATTKEAYEKARINGVIFTHIAQTLACSYEDLYYVNLETEDFIKYRTEDETGMLIEVFRREHFFDSCRKSAEVHVHPEDRPAFINAMEKDTLLKALERNKSFIMSYRRLVNDTPTYVSLKVSRMKDDERFIIICISNVDEQRKLERAAERGRDEQIAYSRLNALAGDFLSVYIVAPETGLYREFSSTEGFESFDVPRTGEDFFEASRKQCRKILFPEDLDRFLAVFTRENVLSEIEKQGSFAISYRLLRDGRPTYVQLKAAMVEEPAGDRLIVGINDIDALVRQEKAYAKRLAQAQKAVNIDTLTRVKTRHAYLDEEERLNRLISGHRVPPFAIVILDVNDLKKINDTAGHQAGDEYIRGACRIICSTFKHSPVFRIGGDEFAVVVQGEDYTRINDLIRKIEDHNTEAARTGGIVVACGMSQYDDDESVAPVFERADLKMYENKSFLKTR